MGRTPTIAATTRALFERRLRELRAELGSELEELEREAFSADAGPPERQGDGGVDSSAQDADIGLIECSEHFLREVVDALERIRQRSYGDCEVCREPIAVERLSVLPMARTCTRCATEREAETRGSRRSSGPARARPSKKRRGRTG